MLNQHFIEIIQVLPINMEFSARRSGDINESFFIWKVTKTADFF